MFRAGPHAGRARARRAAGVGRVPASRASDDTRSLPARRRRAGATRRSGGAGISRRMFRAGAHAGRARARRAARVGRVPASRASDDTRSLPARRRRATAARGAGVRPGRRAVRRATARRVAARRAGREARPGRLAAGPLAAASLGPRTVRRSRRARACPGRGRVRARRARVRRRACRRARVGRT